MMYEVYYYDLEVEASYDYDNDLTGDEDVVVVFQGTLEECREYVSTHSDPDGDPLFIQDTDGFGIW